MMSLCLCSCLSMAQMINVKVLLDPQIDARINIHQDPDSALLIEVRSSQNDY